MVLLESIQLNHQDKLPDFKLADPDNVVHLSESLMGKKGLLIKFTCNHCPYALAVWDRFISLANDAKGLGITSVAINPNIHPDYPADSPENMKVFIREKNLPFPYLVDDTQEIAKSYQAQCTPDIYLLKPDMTLYYHGRIDDNWKDEHLVKNHELKDAIDSLVADKPIPKNQNPSMGCSIKWLH